MTKSILTLGYIRGAYVEGRTPYLRDTNPGITDEEAKAKALEEFDEWHNAWYLRVRTEAWDEGYRANACDPFDGYTPNPYGEEQTS